LFWKGSLLEELEDLSLSSRKCLTDEQQSFLETSSSETLHQALAECDPVMAERWHVHDLRKIKRSLQVFYETGTRYSDVLAEQQSQVKREGSSRSRLENVDSR
jgi:tRNA A37 N6-isopentenylltransferase MiaA